MPVLPPVLTALLTPPRPKGEGVSPPENNPNFLKNENQF